MVFIVACFLLANLGFLAAVGPDDIPCKGPPGECGPRGEGPHWGYGEEDGPDTWGETFDGCAGDAQSPIDIDTEAAVEDQEVGRFHLVDYDAAPRAANVSNNGHSLVFSFTGDEAPPYIEGGRLPEGETFEFLQLHWHWGSDSSKGSEHTINGQQFPLEMHLVHWNTKYETTNDALEASDGLAVLGFMYEVVEEDNEDLVALLEPLGADFVKTGEVIGGVTLGDLLPKNLDKYYFYQGGLTTPNCNEVVLWTNFAETIKISEAQLEQFRSLQDDAYHSIMDNYRPPQPLNDRTVFTNRVEECCATKTVGEILYTLSEMPHGLRLPDICSSPCVYVDPDFPDVPICFRPGNLPVICNDDGTTTTVGY